MSEELGEGGCPGDSDSAPHPQGILPTPSSHHLHRFTHFFVDVWNLSGLAGKVSTETAVVASLWAAMLRASQHPPEAVV